MIVWRESGQNSKKLRSLAKNFLIISPPEHGLCMPVYSGGDVIKRKQEENGLYEQKENLLAKHLKMVYYSILVFLKFQVDLFE